ncbi:cyclase family protein [Candidatus Micrarchaeota archaeon]|nr:cyclase family protein [Candidatus Micrarchaeota archaeon]MBU1165857.1 cyclase family protein [Candidatus Micrarchaeota archaeon]MBU1887019.1 cyclase family protein [Candidatus Micrarchaeota archaeon]
MGNFSKFILLSYWIDENTPTYANGPKLKKTTDNSMENGDSCNTCNILTSNHMGTHVDAPFHFNMNGKRISDYSINELIFEKPVHVKIIKNAGEWVEEEDIKKATIAKDCDCLILETGFGKLRGEPIYIENNPGVSPEAVKILRTEFRQLRCIMLDTVSISGFGDRPQGRESHKTAFADDDGMGEPLLIVEDANILAIEKETKSNTPINRIFLIPWQIKDLDGAPCTVLAEIGVK